MTWTDAVGKRVLVARRGARFQGIIETTVLEVSPSERFVCLQFGTNEPTWVHFTDYIIREALHAVRGV